MLWAVVGLGAVTVSMISTGRNDVALARNLREAATAEAAADGAIHQAGLHLLPCRGDEACATWPADGRRIEVRGPDATLGICISDEAGRVNPNTAQPALLAALLTAIGTEPGEAGRLAAAIVQWRTPAPPLAVRVQGEAYRAAGLPVAPDGQRFAAVDELRFVMGMSPALLDRLRPNLSVWTEGEPDPALAMPAVRTALRALGGGSDSAAFSVATGRTFGVSADASTRGGGRFVRTAIIRVDTAPGRAPLRILTWSAGSATPCR